MKQIDLIEMNIMLHEVAVLCFNAFLIVALSFGTLLLLLAFSLAVKDFITNWRRGK